MYTTIGTYYYFYMAVCCRGWIGRILSTNCCIHTVLHPDDEPRYARNTYRLTKYTKNETNIKFVFLYSLYRDARSTKQKKKGSSISKGRPSLAVVLTSNPYVTSVCFIPQQVTALLSLP
jgi:hypothetical protein